jgi:hypothetical protein
MPAELRGPPIAVAAGEPLREIALSYNADHSICRLKVLPRPDRGGVFFFWA